MVFVSFINIWEYSIPVSKPLICTSAMKKIVQKVSVSCMKYVSMQHSSDKPQAPVFLQEPVMTTWKSVPKSPLLSVHVTCIVQNLTLNRYVESPSGVMLEEKLLQYIALSCPCNYFRSPSSFKTSWVVYKVILEVWHQSGMAIDTVRGACIWEPHKWILRFVPLISVPCSATQNCSLLHVLWSLPTEVVTLSLPL